MADKASSQPPALSSDLYRGHASSEILAALAAHAEQMGKVASEHKSFLASPDHPGTFEGHSSSDIADAVTKYVQQHQDEGWPSDFGDYSASASSNTLASTVKSNAALVGTANVQQLAASPTTAGGNAFSLQAEIAAAQWITIVFSIVWIVAGLLLVLFGWTAYFWGAKLGTSRSRIDEKAPGTAGKRGARHLLFSGPPLAGGVGGAIVGFLFLSFLGLVVTCAMCARDGTNVSTRALFAIWLLPGLVGALLAGHFAFVARVCAGLFAGPCLAVVLTAVFGIRTLIIRVVVVVVFTCLFTASMLVPKRRLLHFHLINASTSIIGMTVLLDGVALYAPPKASSSAWIDLWVVLFAGDDSASLNAATKKWGTSVFKGYIAGAVLGAIVGFIFELILHRHAAQDAESEWNEYLGSYTQRFEDGAAGVLPGFLGGRPMNQRAGSFEPLPSGWSRLGGLFGGGASKPASYGNIPTSGQHDLEKSPLTERPGGMRGKRAGRKSRERQAKTKKAAKKAAVNKGGPAKFSALSKRDQDSGGDFDGTSDSDLTEYESDDAMRKLRRGCDGADEEDDIISPLAHLHKVSAGSPALENYCGYALPRPPSCRTDSQGGSSMLSGTTAGSGSGVVSRCSESGLLTPSASDAEKAFVVYRDGDASPVKQRMASPPPGFSSPASAAPTTSAGGSATAAVPATPSLINAITRIQAAQAQAKAWQEAQGNAARYGAQPLSPSVGDTKALMADEATRCRDGEKGG